MVYLGKPQLPRAVPSLALLGRRAPKRKIIGTRLCEAANCVDRNGNFFEKGAQESAFFGDASAGLDSVSPGLGAGSGAIAFRLPFSRL